MKHVRNALGLFFIPAGAFLVWLLGGDLWVYAVGVIIVLFAFLIVLTDQFAAKAVEIQNFPFWGIALSLLFALTIVSTILGAVWTVLQPLLSSIHIPLVTWVVLGVSFAVLLGSIGWLAFQRVKPQKPARRKRTK